MPILALDLGTKTGWAARLDSAIRSGTQSFAPSRYEGGGIRFLRFRSWLAETVDATGATLVVFEEVRRHKGTSAAHIYGGFLAVLGAFCEEHKLPYYAVPVGEIKKFATGAGNASKDAMIDAMRKRGLDPADDNEADAQSLLLCAEAQQDNQASTGEAA